MAKGVSVQVIIGRISSRVDGSISFSCSTPELSSTEKAVFFDLQNKNVALTIIPMDEPVESTLKIDSEAGEKTPSERLRNKLYARWTESGSAKNFNQYYIDTMEQIISQVEV